MVRSTFASRSEHGPRLGWPWSALNSFGGTQIPFFDDPDSAAAGMTVSYRHQVSGGFEQPRAPWNLGDIALTPTLAPPVLGEHTREVLAEVCLTTVDMLLDSGAAFAMH
jgi:crotonobetainyl-CoA:carnitine CoA-transferase CaiB-like acyl-CoA transferase